MDQNAILLALGGIGAAMLAMAVAVLLTLPVCVLLRSALGRVHG